MTTEKTIDTPTLPPGFAAELIAWQALGRGTQFWGNNKAGFDLVDAAGKKVQVKSGALKSKIPPGAQAAVPRIGIKIGEKTDFTKFECSDYLVIVSTSSVTATAAQTRVNIGETQTTFSIDVTYPTAQIFRVECHQWRQLLH